MSVALFKLKSRLTKRGCVLKSHRLLAGASPVLVRVRPPGACETRFAKIRTPGFVRGLPGNWQSYRDGAGMIYVNNDYRE
jgi:hypothetical protein